MKESAKSMGASSDIDPLYMVETQLKTLMADGIATTKVRKEKTMMPRSLIPEVYMWCPQTAEPAAAMARLEKAIILYPKIGFREKTGMMSEITPMPGRIMM